MLGLKLNHVSKRVTEVIRKGSHQVLYPNNVIETLIKYHDVWDEISYPFPNFNGSTVEVWEWISNFIPHFIVHVITYPRRD